MADPIKYIPGYSYSGWQATNPKKPLPADEVDNDFANVGRSVNSAVDAIKDVRRSDGKLKNQSVGPDQLSPTLSLGFTLRGQWLEGTYYAAGDGVVKDGGFYSARQSHTSTLANAPPSSTWNFLFDVSDIVVAGALSMPRDVFVGDGVATQFALSFSPVNRFNLLVSVGGVLQAADQYSVVGNLLTFNTAPGDDYDVEVRGFATTAELLVPADESVTLPKLSPSVQTSIALANTALQAATGRMQFEDRATAAAATIPTSVYVLSLQAYSASEAPNIGGANYRLATSDAEYAAFPTGLKFTTANSRKFVAHNLENSRQAGVIGDGVGDDYARLQTYADYCGYTGRNFVLADSPKSYRISQKVVFKTTRQLDPADTTPASDVHFTDLLPFEIRGEGKAKVVATAAMASMFELIFNSTLTNIGPFYTLVTNLHLDGNSLATACIKSDYVMHTIYTRNRLVGAQRAVEYTGYGGFRAHDNVIRCKYGFYLVGGGGDSVIRENDFYAAEATSACVYLGYYGGNMVIGDNTFTNDQNFANAYCVQMVGSTAAAAEEIRDVKIEINEFCGFPVAIHARGKASNNKNVWGVKIFGNHVNPFGSNSYGKLLDAADCTDFDVFDNDLNGKRRVDATSDAIHLLRCERFKTHDNTGGNYLNSAFYDQDGIDNDWIGNVMDDVGKSGSGFTCMDVYGNTGTRRIERNVFRQSSASYAQNGIYERDGADFTIALNNEFSGMTNPQRKNATSTNSVMQRTVYGTAAPVSGSWNVGDKVIHKTPAAAGNFGWVCTTAGAPGTWKTFGTIAA